MRKITNPSDPTLTKYYFSDDEIDLILSEGNDNKKNNIDKSSFIDITKEFDEIELFLSKNSNSKNNKASKSKDKNPYFDVQAEQDEIDKLLGMIESKPKNSKPTSKSTNPKNNANVKHIIVQIENLLETLRQQL
jgi:hypothetical protein